MAQTARQKMHLELARHYLRAGDSSLASSEIKEGLAIGGKKNYKEDLRTLMDRLLPGGQRPDSQRLIGGE